MSLIDFLKYSDNCIGLFPWNWLLWIFWYIGSFIFCSCFLGLFMSTLFYIASMCGIVLMYSLYAPRTSCSLNIFFITWTAILLVVMMAMSLHSKVSFFKNFFPVGMFFFPHIHVDALVNYGPSSNVRILNSQEDMILVYLEMNFFFPSLFIMFHQVPINIIVIVVSDMWLFGCLEQVNRGLLSSGIMASYIVFLCWSAIRRLEISPKHSKSLAWTDFEYYAISLSCQRL